jgi:hypothetical protein
VKRNEENKLQQKKEKKTLVINSLTFTKNCGDEEIDLPLY